jgi:hypothetical protein
MIMALKPSATLLLPFSMVATLFISSCQKNDKVDNIPASLQSGTLGEGPRLNFNTQDELRECLKNLMNVPLEQAPEILQRQINYPRSFVSLKTSMEKASSDQDSALISNSRSQKDADVDEDDLLVPDPYIASLLNAERELQVAGTVYKVTPYGTYMCMPGKLQEVRKLADSLNATGYKFPAGNRMIQGETVLENNIYVVGPGILRLDTYKDAATVDITPQSASPREVKNAKMLPEWVYDGLPTFEFDAKTWAGQLIQDVFGRTKPHHEYFDSKHRVKVNFYNVNFGFAATVGVNVKMQTKGWTGIWRKLNTSQLILGWDGLEIEIEQKNMPAPQIPSIDFGKLKLGTIDLDIKSLSIGGHNIGQPLQDAINNALNSAYHSTLKIIWEKVKAIAPEQWKMQDAYVKAFRAVYPDKVKLILDAYEMTAYNTNEITRNFDWNAGFTINWSPSSQASIGTPGGNAYAYKITKGSVFGAAQYYGVWKGARVDKK